MIMGIPSWKIDVAIPRKEELCWELPLAQVNPNISAAKTKFIKFPFIASKPDRISAVIHGSNNWKAYKFQITNRNFIFFPY